MPSSLIFASLVVVWLLILLPAVARRRQEVPRPSTAAPSGRVLPRPVRSRTEEVDEVPQTETETDEAEVDATVSADPEPARPAHDAPDVRSADDTATEDTAAAHTAAETATAHADDDTAADEAATDAGWERPEPRYRPGRGGFDPAAAALAAQARYRFRQRVVMTLLVLVVLTAAAAALLGSPLWWAHAAVDVTLVSYLAYLRRQVRLEEAIRARRAARMAGTRRPAAAEDPQLDEWARRGRAAAAPDSEEAPDAGSGAGRDTGTRVGEFAATAGDTAATAQRPVAAGTRTWETSRPAGHGVDRIDDDVVDEGAAAGARVDGTGVDGIDDCADGGALDESGPGTALAAGGVGRVGVAPAADPEPAAEPAAEPAEEPEPALPRLRRVPPPSLPSGTKLIGDDDLDPDLPAFDPNRRRYRRAAGQ